MKLRYYRKEDFPYIKSWADSERTHFFWCANRIAFPAEADEFHKLLSEHEQLYGARAYCCEDDRGRLLGFCVYLETGEQEGFVKFVIVDSSCRGCGYGTGFMKEMLKTAFQNPEITAVRLNVIDINEAARKCYQKAGFAEKSYHPGSRMFDGMELGVYSMIAVRKENTVDSCDHFGDTV